jgi:hypothetical protein
MGQEPIGGFINSLKPKAILLGEAILIGEAILLGKATLLGEATLLALINFYS